MPDNKKAGSSWRSLRGYFYHYRHAWLAIGLLALLIILLGQTPSGDPATLTPAPLTTETRPAAAGDFSDHENQPSQTTSHPQPVNESQLDSTVSETGLAATPEAAAGSQDKSAPNDQNAPSLILIIDDIGNNLAAGMRAAALPGKVTLAVMPYTPHGSTIANAAYNAGQEIMLHMPMSNQAGMNLGPDGLTADLGQQEMVRRLRLALNDIPHIKGVNNHTGSELTELETPMQWVMQELSHYPLYFIDSMTTAKSVAFDTAREFAIPTLKRHVFLDNIREEDAIRTQFEQAVRIAQQEGMAVAIGHPYEETLTYLEKILPMLESSGVELYFASEFLNRG